MSHVRRLESWPPPQPRKPMRFLSTDEVERLIEVVPREWKAFVLLAAWGGLRFGEIAALTTDRIDFDRRQVRLPRRCVAGDTDNGLSFSGGLPRAPEQLQEPGVAPCGAGSGRRTAAHPRFAPHRP